MISTAHTTVNEGNNLSLVDDDEGSCGLSHDDSFVHLPGQNNKPPHYVGSASALASLDGPISVSAQQSASESGNGQGHGNFKLEFITKFGQHPHDNNTGNPDRCDKSLDKSVDTKEIFSFDLRHIISRKVDLNEMNNLEFLAEGSHSEIYGAHWHGKAVIIKILSSRIPEHARAIQEFNVECELLSRLNHPNIARILGAGTVPRPFLIMERLKDLSHHLNLKSPDPPLGKRTQHT